MNKVSPRSRARNLITEILLIFLPVYGIMYLLHIPEMVGISLYTVQYLGGFLGLVLCLVFLISPAKRGAEKTTLPWYDLVLSCLGLLSCGYIALLYPEIAEERLGQPSPLDLVMGVITVLLIIEATRRMLGWFLTGLVGLFIFYGLYSNLFPGFLYGRGYSWIRVIQSLYFYSDGIFGIAFYVIATICLVYILFGQTLFVSGGGKFLTGISLSLMGRFRGGPAKVAVLASSLFGTISGSAVSNVLTTGVITIPMMKSTGYRPYFAGAVEAAASTGGQIMPPIMGSVAFMIAEFLGISYWEVVVAAVIPAILYYVAVFVQVDLEAAKMGLKGLSSDQLPKTRNSLRGGWQFIIPLAVLVLSLMWLKLRAETAGLYGIASLFLVSMLNKEGRLNLARIRTTLKDTGNGLLEISVLGAMAGIIIGCVTLTGMGINLSQGLVEASRGNVLVLLILAAVASTVMGMGLPVITCYILLAILVAPALVSMGLSPMASHMFIFYYGTLSFLTPPVAPAAYVAAGLAGANAMKVGFQACRLALIAYIVPFIFALNPLLLMNGPPMAVIGAFISAVLGTIMLGIALEGHLWRPLDLITRLFLGAGGLALIVPGWTTDILGLFIAGLFLARELLLKKTKRDISSQEGGKNS